MEKEGAVRSGNKGRAGHSVVPFFQGSPSGKKRKRENSIVRRRKGESILLERNPVASAVIQEL